MTTDTRNLRLFLEGRFVDRLNVVSFRGMEEANRLYRIDVDFTTDAIDDRLEERLLDRGVMLSVQGSGEVVRALYGIAFAVTAHGVYQQDLRAYRLSLVPRMARLKLRRTRRVWTDVSSLDVAATLFREHGVVHRLRIAEAPPLRPYCVQYDETDLAFLTRLFAEDGLFFTFDHPREPGRSSFVTGGGDTEVVVVSDVAAFYAALDGGEDLRFERTWADSALSVRDDQVTYFAPRAAVRPSAVRARGYDMRRPTSELRREALHHPETKKGVALSEAHEPRTITLFEGSYEGNIPVASPGLPATTVPRSAAHRLDAVRRKARVIEGTSFCRRLSPGKRFVLHDHELRDFDGGYVVLRVEHEGYGADVVPAGRALYQNRFTCLPDSVPLRSLPRKKPRAVTETAVVVGPPGQETHTDDLGRVRVRFFWDLSGRPADQATAWARVAHSWAGSGWGTQFIPRPGMEVVVTYLDGDPDRPLVTGCVYNARQVPPFELPENVTQSGIRSRSTPGGAGGNELRFEDRRGEEHVLLQAQRDLTVVAARARTVQIGEDDEVRVTGHRTDHVGENLRTTVGGSEQREVRGALRVSVTGTTSRVALGADAVRALRDRHVEVGGDLVVHVEGSRFATGGAPGADRPCVDSAHVFGDRVTTATGQVRFSADAGLVLECGESRIEVTKEGVRISGPSLTFAGAESTTLSGKGPSLHLGEVAEMAADKMRFFAKDAWLVLDKDVRMKGELVKMNCDDEKPAASLEEPAEVKKRPIKIKLSDAEFTAYGNRKYQILVDGDVYEGTTTPGGIVDKQVSEDAKSLQLVVWLGDYPTGEKRTWVLASVPMPPPTDVKGAQLRLQNLGYRSGDATGTLDDDTRKALASFQSDAGLPPTGMLDEATAAKLAETHSL
jgi:type VI secretion system secreted protein VgrG